MVDLELNDLKREFLGEAREKVDEMQSALESATSQGLDRLTYLAHQLKGAGGSYGYARISSDAAALEKALEQRITGDGQAGDGQAGDGQAGDEQIQQHVVNLRLEIDRCARELA